MQHAHHRAGEPRHLPQVARNGLRLPALLGVDARIGARRIQERDDRPPELGRQLHHPDRLAVTLRLGHSEIAEQFLLGVPPLLLADHHYGPAFEERETGHDGGIVAEAPVAVDFVEIRENPLDVVERMRPLGMPRQQHALPRRVFGRGRRLFRLGRFGAHCLNLSSSYGSFVTSTLLVSAAAIMASASFCSRKPWATSRLAAWRTAST